MKILITTYHQAFLKPGGGENELLEMVTNFSDNGVKADIYGHTSRPLDFYDAVVHFSAHGGGEQLLENIKKAGKPIILIPNYDYFSGDGSSTEVVKSHQALADLIIVRSDAARQIIIDDYDVDPNKVRTIKVGVKSAYGVKMRPGIFSEAYGIDNFGLWVGKIVEHKRHLETLKMLHDIDTDFVLLGGYQDKKYLQDCRQTSNNKTHFLGQIKPASEMLRAAYKDCSFYLELGDDYPGISAVEAFVCGCPMILKEHPWSREYFGDFPTYVSGNDANELADAISEIQENSSIHQTRFDKDLIRFIQPAPTSELKEAIEEITANLASK